MEVWIIMCSVPCRRAVCQEEVEKQLFTFVTTSRCLTRHVQAVVCFIYEAALEPYVLACFFASAHLTPHLLLLLLLELQSDNPEAFSRASVCCHRLMNGSSRVKMAAV